MSVHSPALQNRPLFLIAGLLFLSALMRFSLHADDAWAFAQPSPKEQPEEVQERALNFCAQNGEPEALILALEEKRQRLAQQEDALRTQELVQKISIARIKDQLKELEAAETALSDMIARAELAAEKDVSQLIAVYSAMKPKQAALLFEEMDATFASGFLGLMKPRIAADIMADLSPEKAYVLSVLLAGRNASVPSR